MLVMCVFSLLAILVFTRHITRISPQKQNYKHFALKAASCVDFYIFVPISTLFIMLLLLLLLSPVETNKN